MELTSAVGRSKRPIELGALLLACVVGIPGIAVRLGHLRDLPLSATDDIGIGLGIGLFVASMLDFWSARIRRGLAISVLRLALTGCVALHVDVPIALPAILHTYADAQMRVAVSTQDKVRASLTVLAIIDRSPLLSLIAMTPSQLVDGGYCPLFVAEYDRHVARTLPAISPYFAKGLRACRLETRRSLSL